MSKSTSLQIAAQRYLEERRRLGFDLRFAGKQLMRFAQFADDRAHCGPLTLDLQLDWARAPGRRSGSITSARRLEIVRPFAKYYRQFEPHTVVPDSTTFGRGHRRLTPHIYSETEICDMLTEAGRLAPKHGLRPRTYQALFGLISAAGLRLSEALHLRDADVDLLHGSIIVRQTKFKKSRCLPLHESTVDALRSYCSARNLTVARDRDMPFFVSAAGSALPSRTVHSVFVGLRTRLGWNARGGHPHPRIHDLRHTFAVRRVLDWQKSGMTVEHGLVMLCTYLGHAKVSDTYWYLTAVPELLAIVGTSFERFASRVMEAVHA